MRSRMRGLDLPILVCGRVRELLLKMLRCLSAIGFGETNVFGAVASMPLAV